MLKYQRGLTILFGTLLLVGCPESSDQSPSTANDIIKNMGGSCSTWGRWSEVARAQTESLVATLESLKKRDKCVGFAQSISTIHGLAGNIHDLMGDPELMRYRQKQEEFQELTLALNRYEQFPQDQLLNDALKLAVVNLQTELARARAEAITSSRYSDKVGQQDQYSRASRQLSELFKTFFSQSGDLTSCLKESPEAAFHLASTLSAVGGSFLSPLYGSSAYIIGELLSISLRAFSQYRIDQAVWNFNEGLMPSALMCGLDSLTSYYCQAQDSFDLLYLQAQNYASPGAPPHAVWEGMDILTRRLPVLNEWLLEIKNGVEPNNPDDSARINRIRQKYNQLDLTNNRIKGELNQAKRFYDQSPSNDTRLDILVGTVSIIAESFSENRFVPNNDEADPFKKFASDKYSYACWLLKGINSACPPSLNMFDPIRDYITRNGLEKGVTIADIISLHWPSILARVTNKVIIEFNDTVFIDPDILLVKGSEPLAQNLSPKTILQLIQRFLQKLLQQSEPGQAHRRELLTDTIGRIDRALRMLQVNQKGRTEKIEQFNALGELSEIFKLEFGTQFFSSRIGHFVEWDLQDRLRRGEFPMEIAEILRASSGEIRHRLEASGSGTLDEISTDLDEARGIAESNIENFRKFFLPALKRAVEELFRRAQAERPEDGPKRVYSQRLARLCALILSSHQKWDDSISWEICSAQTLYSIQPQNPSQSEAPLKIDLSQLRQFIDSITNDPNQKKNRRICAYYDFRRASRIAQILSEGARVNKFTDDLTADFAPLPTPKVHSTSVLDLFF